MYKSDYFKVEASGFGVEKTIKVTFKDADILDLERVPRGCYLSEISGGNDEKWSAFFRFKVNRKANFVDVAKELAEEFAHADLSDEFVI